MNKDFRGFDAVQMTRLSRPSPDEAADRIEIGELMSVVWRNKWVLLGTMIVCGALAFGLTKTVEPTYSALSKVMLDHRDRRVLGNYEVVSDLDLSTPVMNSETAVLRSNVLIEKVIRSLGIERFESIDPTKAEPGLLSRGEDEGPAETLSEEVHVQALVWAVRKNLSIYREGESYVIGIQAETPDPALSMDIANKVAEEYIAQQLASRTDLASRATLWLEDRVTILEGQVQEAETAVELYRAESLILDGGSLDAASQQLAELNNQLVLARADRVAADARYRQILASIQERGIAAVGDIVTSPLIVSLNQERVTLERQDSSFADTYEPNHPARARITAEIARIDQALEAETAKIVEGRRADVEIAQLREESMQQSIDELETQIVATSQTAIGLRQLEREADAARQIYEQLLVRLNETRAQEQLQQADARVIENATLPGRPVAPRPKLMTIMGATLGLIVGFVLIFAREFTRSTFRSVSEVQQATSLPVLSSIPRTNWATPKDAVDSISLNANSLPAERVRHLRTSLLMRGGKTQPRSILTVSAQGGEGKTTTTVALAKMTAAAGRSVIVVDCDLRRSSIQKSFGWKLQPDFVDFIQDRCTVDEAIYSDPELGFDVLATTGAHPHEADQLSASWLKPLIDDLKEVYDVVLVDAPAVLAVSDALVLAQCVDTSVFLIRWNKTTRSSVQKVLNSFDDMRLHLSGVVMTMVDPDSSEKSYRSKKDVYYA